MSIHSKKVALVTGSSRGIGLAIARELDSAGYQVVLNSRDNSSLIAAADNICGAKYVKGDVSTLEGAKDVIRYVIDTFGKLDTLVCNVGSGKSVKPGQETYNEWQRVFANNLWSATNVVECAYPYLVESQGVVLCISSICGLEVIPGAPVTYSVAKAALNAYVKGMARPFGEQGVRINAIAPGNILFSGSVWEEKLRDNPIDTQKIIEQDTPLKKLGGVEDISKIAKYLVSAEASFVTGKVWGVDGGMIRG